MNNDLVLGGVFTIPRGFQMISARGEAESQKWVPAIGKSKRLWLYHPDRSTVWVAGGRNSQGCGGAEVSFELEDGDKVTLKGPWCSNSDAFFADTGIDVRNNHVTWGCIGRERTFDGQEGETRIRDLVWFDREPTRGPYDRVEMTAWEIHERTGENLVYYMESHGGSSHGPVSMPYRVRVQRGLQKEILL